MGYFSNASEFDDFEARNCARCVHLPETDVGCPVADAHFLYSYELCNKKEDPGKVILEMLMPRKDLTNECRMFHEKQRGG